MSKRSLRAIFATRIFVPEPAAASFRLRALARAIVHEGGSVLVLTSDLPQGLSDDIDEAGIEVSRRKVARDSEGYVRGYVPYLTFDLPLFFRLMTAPRPDVVICEPPPTTGFITRIVCALRRLPYVYYAADVWADAAESSAPAVVVSILRLVENWAMRGAQQIIAVSDAVRGRLAELGHTNVTVARNGIDTDVFTDRGPTAPDMADDLHYFVYAGTASEWQGAEIFARAMKRVYAERPDTRLVYLGQGSSSVLIEQLAKDVPHGVITQKGRVDAESAAAWQRGATSALVSIKPGLGYDFAMPTKVYSALAVGTPVIYAGPGPLREAIRANDLGRVVDYDVDAVSAAMLAALTASRSEESIRRRRAWVVDNHSLDQTGRAALAGVKKAVR